MEAAPLLGFVFEIQYSFFANRPESRASTGIAKYWGSIELGFWLPLVGGRWLGMADLKIFLRGVDIGYLAW